MGQFGEDLCTVLVELGAAFPWKDQHHDQDVRVILLFDPVVGDVVGAFVNQIKLV